MLILLHLGAKGFDLGQRREGGSPLGLNQILQHKAAHPLGLKGHALGLGAFTSGMSNLLPSENSTVALTQ